MKTKAVARPSPPAYTSSQMATNLEFAVSRLASVNQATGEVLGERDSAGPTEVRAAVARAPLRNSLPTRALAAATVQFAAPSGLSILSRGWIKMASTRSNPGH